MSGKQCTCFDIPGELCDSCLRDADIRALLKRRDELVTALNLIFDSKVGEQDLCWQWAADALGLSTKGIVQPDRAALATSRAKVGTR